MSSKNKSKTTDLPNIESITILKNEIERLNKKLKAHNSAESLIRDTVKEALITPVSIKLPPTPKADKSSKDTEIAVLHISDTQIGKVTETYNSDIAEKRLLYLIEKTINIVKLRRNTAKIDEIRVYLGGDIVEGHDIFPGQAHLIDSDVFKQAVTCAPAILTKCIGMLLRELPKVKVLCVPGNHGRDGMKSGGWSKATNWDNVAYHMTKMSLLASDKSIEDRLDFKTSDSWYAVDDVLGWGNLIVHGDQIGGGFAGFPWYGVGKKVWGWIDSIPSPFDYVYLGHFHTFAKGTLNHRMFLANGTTESDNEFAQETMAASGYPCQRLSFYNKKYGLVADHQIFLTLDGERKPKKLTAESWL
jgi:hypothetical protein